MNLVIDKYNKFAKTLQNKLTSLTRKKLSSSDW